MTWQNVKFLITKTNNKTDIPNSTISSILYASTRVNNDLLFLEAEDDQENRDKLKKVNMSIHLLNHFLLMMSLQAYVRLSSRVWSYSLTETKTWAAQMSK